jgi:hypothetical protein
VNIPTNIDIAKNRIPNKSEYNNHENIRVVVYKPDRILNHFKKNINKEIQSSGDTNSITAEITLLIYKVALLSGKL